MIANDPESDVTWKNSRRRNRERERAREGAGRKDKERTKERRLALMHHREEKGWVRGMVRGERGPRSIVSLIFQTPVTSGRDTESFPTSNSPTSGPIYTLFLIPRRAPPIFTPFFTSNLFICLYTYVSPSIYVWMMSLPPHSYMSRTILLARLDLIVGAERG